MENVLKILQGKSLTKKNIFDILSDLDINNLNKQEIKYEESQNNEIIFKEKKEPIEEIIIIRRMEPDNEVEIKCESCSKIFLNSDLLEKHLSKHNECIIWKSHPDKTDNINLETGLHLTITKILCQALRNENKLECKWCKSSFISVGNLNKHLNTSRVCNKLTFVEFKKLINEI